MRIILSFLMLVPGASEASEAYPPPVFTDSARARKLAAAMPEADRIFRAFAVEQKIPGLVWGVVIDGKTAHVGSWGTMNRSSLAPVTDNTVFRIASMTKSFTALAILKLRDAGKLSLEDPVARWIPEFGRLGLPTRDSAPLTIRQLMSHSSGLPEDNPWGDRQLSASDTDLTRWLRNGIPFSTPPGTRYEYSNYAFGVLGRVVTRASRVPYEKYVSREILDKLGMSSTTFEYSSVPAKNRAVGYRLEPDGSYSEEPPLAHGVFGAMGGLLTTAGDLGRYVAFHLSAWPPRDDMDNGPVRRSSVREMSHMWTPSNLSAVVSNDRVGATQSGYGFGLRVTTDCRFETLVGHGGGLPGFGSYMIWLPDYGVGIFAMANLTYAGPAAPANRVLDALVASGGLRQRELPASPPLSLIRLKLIGLWKKWDEIELEGLAAMNLLLDGPATQRRLAIQKIQDEVGPCTEFGPLVADNWLRGQFNIGCRNGTVGVFYSLAPTQSPLVQHLEFRKLTTPVTRMFAPTGAPAGVACSQ